LDHRMLGSVHQVTSGQPCAAIDLVAYDHPDAEPECIAAAYAAFDREHGEDP
jgi:hypothetical protein